MVNQVNQPSLKIRLWHYLPILIIMGLAVHLLVPQITTLENSWSVVQGMTWWAVAPAVISQALSYLGSGFTLHAIPDTNQKKLSTLRDALITMASTSIGLVAGGWVGAAAATYGWIRLESHDGNTATLAGTLPAIRTIEITTTTRLTELRKDIDNAFEEIRNMKAEQKDLSDSQKFKWRTLADERAKEKEELGKRWEMQTEINQGIKTMTKLLWVVAGIVLSLLIGFIWQLIVNGGIRGIIGGQLP